MLVHDQFAAAAGQPPGSRELVKILERLARIESALESLVRERAVKEWYSTAEAAEILGKAEFTVREWCRTGRIHAQKRMSGRGPHASWVIAHAELERIRREGLLPLAGHEPTPPSQFLRTPTIGGRPQRRGR
jgi:hypothetical protein